jgi:hypothetical protein
MPRIGTVVARDPYGVTNSDSGEGTFMRSHLASVLTTWTVSIEYTYGAASLERSYFVLSQGAYEILVVMGNGTTVSFTSMVHPTYQAENDYFSTGPLGLAFSPTGGFEANLIAGLDPFSDLAFWPSDSSLVKTLEGYGRSPGNAINLYAIENTTYPELFLYVGEPTNEHSFWGFSDEIFDFSRVPANPDRAWETYGILAFDYFAKSGPGPYTTSRTLVTAYSPETGRVEAQVAQNEQGLAFLTDDVQPIGTDYAATRMLVFMEVGTNEESYPFANFNRSLVRRMANTEITFREKFDGGGTDEVFVHLFQYYLTPWASALAKPA